MRSYSLTIYKIQDLALFLFFSLWLSVFHKISSSLFTLQPSNVAFIAVLRLFSICVASGGNKHLVSCVLSCIAEQRTQLNLRKNRGLSLFASVYRVYQTLAQVCYCRLDSL